MLDDTHAGLCAHADAYGLLISAGIVSLFCYIAYVDFRTFKIPNRALLLLLALYVLGTISYARLAGVLGDGLFAALVFAICLLFYSRSALGGGDVKFLPVAFLLIGVRDALPFCILLLLFILMHYSAVRLGWARSRLIAGRHLMPYAPSVAGAFLATNSLSCYLAHWSK
jgi:Flp pilus assembly protein protease CpaA